MRLRSTAILHGIAHLCSLDIAYSDDGVHHKVSVWTDTGKVFGVFCSFIYQVASAKRQRSDLFCLQAKLPLVTTSLTIQT